MARLLEISGTPAPISFEASGESHTSPRVEPVQEFWRQARQGKAARTERAGGSVGSSRGGRRGAAGQPLARAQRGSLRGREGVDPSPRPAGTWVRGRKAALRKGRPQAEEGGGRVWRRAGGWEVVHAQLSDSRGLWGRLQETPRVVPGSGLGRLGRVRQGSPEKQNTYAYIPRDLF